MEELDKIERFRNSGGSLSGHHSSASALEKRHGFATSTEEYLADVGAA
jgi:hypothetical protein